MNSITIFKNKINLDKGDSCYIPNGYVFEKIELEYFKDVELGNNQNVLGMTIVTKEQQPRTFKLVFEIYEDGDFTSCISIETKNFYKIKGSFNIDETDRFKSIFKNLYENSEMEYFDKESLINYICSKIIPYAIKHEADIRFHNEEDRLSLLKKNLDLYVKTMNSNINEMSMILDNINYIMSTEAMACSGHIFDTNVAKPFGPSMFVEKEIKYFNEVISKYNSIFEDVLEDKTLLDYLLDVSDNFKEIYNEITTVYADYTENATINYLTLSSSGTYLVNRLNYINKKDLNIKTFLQNNVYECLVNELDFETGLDTFDSYHIGSTKNNYIELNIKETDTNYYIKSCKNDTVLYEFKVSKNDLKDKLMVFTNQGYIFSDRAIIVDDKTFEFNVLEEDCTKFIGFDDIIEYYKYKEEINKRDLQALNFPMYEEKVYDSKKTDCNSSINLDDIDYEEIPF